jgi:hypothetical protein
MITIQQIEMGLDKLANVIAYLSTADMKDDDRDESLAICDRLYDGLCIQIDEFKVEKDNDWYQENDPQSLADSINEHNRP